MLVGDLWTFSNVVENLPCKTPWKILVFAKITSSAFKKICNTIFRIFSAVALLENFCEALEIVS